MHLNKRRIIDEEEFDINYLTNLMMKLFPKKNDCASRNELEEVVSELKCFEVRTKKQIRLLLKKHRRWLLDVEKQELDKLHQRIYREELGSKEFLDSIRRQYWFCFPALIRNIMEIEFGDKYEKFSIERDKI